MEKIKTGVNAIHIRNGINKAVVAVNAELEGQKIVVDDIDSFKAIATISSQDEEIGALVSYVVQEVGKDGAITVEPGQSIGIEYSTSEGMQVSSGFISPHFVNKKDKAVSVMEDSFILVTDERILNVQQILPIVQMVHEKNGTLVIIAESVEHEALATLVMNLPWINKEGSNFISLAIRAPEIGDRRKSILEDIAQVTGARFISKSTGVRLENAVLADLGRAKKIIANSRVTTIVEGAGDKDELKERVDQIREFMEAAEGEEKDFLKGRLANITGSIGVLRVGAASEIEQREKQHRVEDAIAAVRAAADEGIVPGGGTAYIRCRDCIDALEFKSNDEKTGAEIVKAVLTKPLWWIAKNAGYDADAVVEKVLKSEKGQGFNAETGEYVDMIENDIIDPKKVSRCALENAASVAGSFLTSEVAITDIPEVPKK